MKLINIRTIRQKQPFDLSKLPEINHPKIFSETIPLKRISDYTPEEFERIKKKKTRYI